MSNYNVIPTEKFEEDVKYYIKKKKYLHIKDDIKIITDQLEKGNLIGDEIPNIQVSVDNHTYKVRTVNTDSNEGKSNGYRIIYYVIKDDLDIYLVTIYSKKDDKRIPTNSEIIKLIANYCIN